MDFKGMDWAEELIRIAQNDYMIDGKYLLDGLILTQAAEEFRKYEYTVEQQHYEILGLQEEIAGEDW